MLNMSDEFRNPLNSMLGNLQLAMMESLPQTLETKLRSAMICGELLLSQINNILDKGKVDSNNLEYNPAPINVVTWLDKMWKVCSEMIRERGLQGVINIDKNMPTTLALDQSRLTQILLNIVGNAVKFTQTGSVSITLLWAEGRVDLNNDAFQPQPYSDSGIFEKDLAMQRMNNACLNLDNIKKARTTSSKVLSQDPRRGYFKILVKDTGVGISAQKLSKLFDGPGRGETSRRNKASLGLFITKQICNKM